MKRILLTAVCVMAGLAVKVQAEPRCGDREVLTQFLAKKYGEAPVARGLSQGRIVEMWGNEETGTWTAISTTPNGVTCLLASGGAF